jgi:hypothetical protein
MDPKTCLLFVYVQCKASEFWGTSIGRFQHGRAAGDTALSFATGPPHKLSERVTRQTPLSRGAIASVLAALKLADLQGFDPQPENAVAAGSFCFAPPGLPPQQVPPPA